MAYTNAKLLSNTDTLTSWLEGSTGGVGQVQDWNNLAGERSLSSQDVSQRLVISYVLDLPFGHGKAFLNGCSGFDRQTCIRLGNRRRNHLPARFSAQDYLGWTTDLHWSRPISVSNNIRPDVVPGCSKGGNRILTAWFNTSLLCSAAAVGLWYRIARGFFTPCAGNQQL